jgi:hypothetical protein
MVVAEGVFVHGSEEMVTDLFSDHFIRRTNRPWTACRVALGLSLVGYAVVFALEVFRWGPAPLIAEASRFLFWWVLLPVWAASFLQGHRVNWRRAGWAVLETAVAGVLALVFSVGLLGYAYHQERQKMERVIADLRSR